MRKLLLLIIIFTAPIIGYAQYNWDIGFQLGASNYLGEMGGKHDTRKNFVYDMKLNKTQFTAGAFGRYKFNSLISAQLGFNWVRITGADDASTNPARVGRNLSFRDDVLELALTAQVFFFEIPDLGHTYKYKNDFKMYAFGGVGGFYYNPKAVDPNTGNWVALRPLETEGVHYSSFNISIPAGLGFLFTINKRHRIGWEFNWRTTFTDYLDDDSGTYVDPKTLSSDEARTMANRRNELGNVPTTTAAGESQYGRAGEKRGDPSHKDSYLTTSVYYSYVIRGRSSLYKSKYGSIFRKSKGKKRKIRAKF